MTFDGLLDQACKSAGLPDMARILLPSALSEKTKKMALKMSQEEIGDVLKTAINAIDHGSVESVDTLVSKQFNK